MFRRTPSGRFFLLLLGALAFAACSDGGTGPRTPGGIAGEVRADDDQPLPDALVELARVPADSARRARTDAAGRFSFTPLPAGTYEIRVIPPAGYEAPAAPLRVTVRSGDETPAAVRVRAVREAEVAVAAGGADTVNLASGLVAAFSVDAGAPAATLRLAETPTTSFAALPVVSTPVEVVVAGPAPAASAGARRQRARDGEDDTSISVQVWQRVATCAEGRTDLAFQVTRRAGEPPVFLFAEATCTTYTDPATGTTSTAVVGTARLRPGTRLSLAAFQAESECAGGERALYTAGGEPADPSRIPVILIHGWQPLRLSCRSFAEWRPENETWGPMADALRGAHGIGDRYQLWVLRYPTFEPVANAVSFLRAEIVSRGWAGQDIVLVGHSMGGLVGRGYIAAHGGDRVRALVTLGTPHAGSTLASRSGGALLATRTCAGDLGLVVSAAYPRTRGFQDLAPESDWIRSLATRDGWADRIYTIGGELGVLDDPSYLLSRCILALSGGGTRTDGVVSVESALPGWSTMQIALSGQSHGEIHQAGAIPHVRDVLQRLAVCRPGPPPAAPGTNAFPLSGTVARLPDGEIDIVLNPIVVGGEPRRGLTSENFLVVENDCVKEFRITTAEGNLGVDLVFIQDLSGSMGGEIAGVRASVLAFAADLASRGLNVRMGSVGFSGPGGLATHPGAGTCESIGPVHDLGSAEAFRAHVADEWFAVGGCDSPENALEALEYAHRNLTWRAGAARVYVLITDVSIHTAGTNCNGRGPCTDQTLESIVSLVGSTSTIHAVAPASSSQRTAAGGLDPWLLAQRTGGAQAVLRNDLDLNDLGITDRIAEVVRLTFTSTSTPAAHHRLRVRVEVDGQVAELSPGLVRYDLHPSLSRPAARRR